MKTCREVSLKGLELAMAGKSLSLTVFSITPSCSTRSTIGPQPQSSLLHAIKPTMSDHAELA